MDFIIKHITTEKELDVVLAFEKRMFANSQHINTGEYSREKWVERMKDYSDLLLYAEANGEVSAMVFGRIETNGGVTVGPVASDPQYRKRGMARALMQEIEKRAHIRGIHLLTLGAVESAEGFYLKCGYIPLLFIQTKPPHTLEALRVFNTKYHEAWSYDDGADIRLMLATNGIDRELQHKYDKAFPGCSTQTVFTKNI